MMRRDKTVHVLCRRKFPQFQRRTARCTVFDREYVGRLPRRSAPQWWGDPESLHLDCWGPVEQADGFDIALTTDAPRGGDANKLFFVNLGGYDPAQFTELHRNVLLVVPDANAAKAKAKAGIRHWATPHKDRLFEVEQAVDLTALMQDYGYSLKLTKAAKEKPFVFVCKYLPIG
jgi:hypothetical protein